MAGFILLILLPFFGPLIWVLARAASRYGLPQPPVGPRHSA